MGFCSKCGGKLSEDAYFCPRCGARTKKGIEAGVAVSSDEVREAFAKMGQELEKAFVTAAKEIQKAFKPARENVRQSTSETVVCSNCGEKNQKDSKYCYKCGKKL